MRHTEGEVTLDRRQWSRAIRSYDGNGRQRRPKSGVPAEGKACLVSEGWEMVHHQLAARNKTRQLGIQFSCCYGAIPVILQGVDGPVCMCVCGYVRVCVKEARSMGSEQQMSGVFRSTGHTMMQGSKRLLRSSLATLIGLVFSSLRCSI